MTRSQARNITDFVLLTDDVKLTWPGPVDITGTNLDEFVTFTEKQFDIDFEGKKSTGNANHKLIQIILVEIRGIQAKPGKSNEHYRKKLEKMCVKMGATFRDWNPDSKIWKFEIDGE